MISNNGHNSNFSLSHSKWGRVATTGGPAEASRAQSSIRKGSINRGRFRKFYEEEENKIRFWGMCDVSAETFKIYVSKETFFKVLECFNTRTYNNLKEILKNMSLDDQRFLLDGVSPKGWVELAESFNSVGITDPIGYSGMTIKRVLRSGQKL